MKRVEFGVVMIAVGLLFAVGATAQESLIIYPAAGQSADQLNSDKAECMIWATGQTGFDPLSPPSPPTLQAAPNTQGAAVKGAARGALGGAAIGAIAGDAGKGAAIGAAAGGGRGAIKRGQAQQESAQSNEAAMQAYQSDLTAKQGQHRKAMGACLEGRKYTVN